MSNAREAVNKVIEYVKKTVPNDILAEEINSHSDYYIEANKVAIAYDLPTINDADCAVFYRNGYIDAIVTVIDCLEEVFNGNGFHEPTMAQKYFSDGIDWEGCKISKDRSLELSINKKKGKEV